MMSRGPTYPIPVSGSSPNVAPAVPNGTNQAAPMNQLRPVPAIPRMSNTIQGVNSVPSNAQAPMQPQLGIQHRLPVSMVSDNARIIQEASRLSNEQRLLAAQGQQQQPPSNGQAGISTSPNMSRINAAPHHNTSLFGGIQFRSGSPSVSGRPPPNGSSASPIINNPSQPQPLSNGTIPVINQIQNQVKARHPQASPEQINAITTDTLSQYRMSHPQAALQAAAGNPNAAAMSHNASINGIKSSSQSQQQAMMSGVNGVNSRAMMNPQEYAQRMMSQQSGQQSRSMSSGLQSARTMSRSATPQTHPGHAPSHSPRSSQAPMAGAQ